MAISRRRTNDLATNRLARLAAPDEQHQRRETQHDPQSESVPASNRTDTRGSSIRRKPEASPALHPCLGIAVRGHRLEPAEACHVQLSRSLSCRPTRAETAHRSQPERVPRLQQAGAPGRQDAERHEDVDPTPDFDTEEGRRRHPDHRDLSTTHTECLADDGIAPREVAEPKGVADDGDGVAPRAVVAWSEHTAAVRDDAQGREGVSTHPRALDRASRTLLTDRHLRGCPSEDTGQSLLVIADLLPDRVRQGVPALIPPEPAVAPLDGDLNELLRLGERERPQPHRVQDLKHRRVGAGSQRQRENRHGRESRSLAEHTCAVRQVRPHALEDAEREEVVTLFLHAREVSELPVGRGLGIPWGQPRRPVTRGELVDMKLELLTDLLVVSSTEQRPDPQADRCEEAGGSPQYHRCLI